MCVNAPICVTCQCWQYQKRCSPCRSEVLPALRAAAPAMRSARSKGDISVYKRTLIATDGSALAKKS